MPRIEVSFPHSDLTLGLSSHSNPHIRAVPSFRLSQSCPSLSGPQSELFTHFRPSYYGCLPPASDRLGVPPIQAPSLSHPSAPDLGMGRAHVGPGPSFLCGCSSDVTQGTGSPQQPEADLQREGLAGQSSGRRKEMWPPTLHGQPYTPSRSGTSHILEHSSSPPTLVWLEKALEQRNQTSPTVCTSVQPWTGSSCSHSLHIAPRAGGPTLPVPPPLGPA